MWIERFSRAAVFVTVVIFGLLRLGGIELNLSAQVTIALVGLLFGIPHGAIDHLISISSTPRIRFYIYIITYVLIAIVAGWIIAKWNLIGFQLVIVMSSLHFGYGDASFRNEWQPSSHKRKFSMIVGSAYAIPAGFLPVILPLTDPGSGSALGRVHSSLLGWAGSQSDLLRNATLTVAVAGLAILIMSKSYAFAIDLILLGGLALTAPPLVAFAVYFGFWHAARHTARLVPKLTKARSLAEMGRGVLALRAAITPGLYAVIGAIALAAALMVLDRGNFASGLLWSTLVVIWALTVPHMLTTARFDRQALKN